LPLLTSINQPHPLKRKWSCLQKFWKSVNLSYWLKTFQTLVLWRPKKVWRT